MEAGRKEEAIKSLARNVASVRNPDQALPVVITHPIQRTPGQYALGGRSYAASIAMQVPLDGSSIDLRKHGGYLIDVRWVDATSSSMWRSSGSEEEIADSERAKDDNKEK